MTRTPEDLPIVSDVPNDRLGRIADEMFAVIHRHEAADVRAIVMLHSTDTDEDGIADAMCAHHGYSPDEPEDVLADALLHIRAIARAQHQPLLIGGFRLPEGFGLE